jgi:hypothetical protein
VPIGARPAVEIGRRRAARGAGVDRRASSLQVKVACETIEEWIIDGVTSPTRLPQKIVFVIVTPETVLPVASLSLDVI